MVTTLDTTTIKTWGMFDVTHKTEMCGWTRDQTTGHLKPHSLKLNQSTCITHDKHCVSLDKGRKNRSSHWSIYTVASKNIFYSIYFLYLVYFTGFSLKRSRIYAQ